MEGDYEIVYFEAAKEGHDHNFSEMLEPALLAAFKEHPNATYCIGESFSRAWENRNGSPMPVTIVKLRLREPA